MSASAILPPSIRVRGRRTRPRRKSEILQDLVQRQHRLTGRVLGGVGVGGLLGKGDIFKVQKFTH